MPNAELISAGERLLRAFYYVDPRLNGLDAARRCLNS